MANSFLPSKSAWRLALDSDSKAIVLETGIGLFITDLFITGLFVGFFGDPRRRSMQDFL
jgi:hypothetical protein